MISAAAYLFHRNDALDARSHFDVGDKPDFHRNQFGATFGGPLQENRTFFFLGYESLIERLGEIDFHGSAGRSRAAGGAPLRERRVNAAVAPYSPSIPARMERPSGKDSRRTFPFSQRLDEHFLQTRVDYNLGTGNQLFARYTLDDTDQFLPTDYPPVPAQLHFTEPVLHG